MSERTEQASTKKKQDERKKGNIFQSKDIITLASLITSFMILKMWSGKIYEYTANMYIKYVSLISVTEQLDTGIISLVFKDIITTILMACGWLMIALPLISIIATGAQTKFIFTPVKIKFSKLNPLSGIKNMFSLKAVVELIKNLIKITILGIVIFNTMKESIVYVPKLMSLSLLSGIEFISTEIMDIVKSVVIAFGIIAGFDFFYQWWDYSNKLKMTKQEVREEYKQQEGDPHVKGQRKQRQKEISMNRMMQDVATADVVVRNPTHFAVAIKYNMKTDIAPTVVAKGMNNIALKIVEIAKEHKINTMENIPLARALYAKAEVGKMVPIEYFEEVAEVLAWVYNLREEEKGTKE